MPWKLYNKFDKTYYPDEETMKLARKNRDNMRKKKVYWRKVYNYDVDDSQYDEFIENIPIIKKIHKIHDFICATSDDDKESNIPKEDLETYIKYNKYIKQARQIKPFLLTLKRLS